MSAVWLSSFREAAKAVREAIEPLVGTKSAATPLTVREDGDVTRKIDAVAEKTAVEVLQRNHKPFTLVSEELGIKDFGRDEKATIVLDPLDGSYNAIVGIPAYSFSVAFARGRKLSEVCEALVADLPRGVLYEAEVNRGARCGDDPLSPSRVNKLSESLISADLNIVDLRNYMKKVIRILNVAKRKRYLGTNALELCLVASGKYDAFVDLRGISRVTDIAAGYLILKEAGGVIVDEKGMDVDVQLHPTSRLSFVAAANRGLSENILMNLR